MQSTIKLHFSGKLYFPVVLLVMLAGCATNPGIAPHATMLQPQSLTAETRTDTSVFPRQHWWKIFGDKKLDALIAQAIEKNQNLKVVQSRMIGANALIDEADSRRYPQIDAKAQSTREHLSLNSIYPPPLGGNFVSMSSASISAQWQIDWFGRQRATLDAAIGQARAAQADMQAARVILATSVAQQYFNLARQQEQQSIRKQMLHASELHAQLVDQRVAAGLDSKMMQRQTQVTVLQFKRDLTALDEQIALSRHAMALLLGAEPGETSQLDARLPLNINQNISARLPAELLGHRADVVAARWRVESELKNVKAARADFYPNLNLIAFAGFESINLSNWLSAGSRSYGAGPAISLPIFNAGRLRAQLRQRAAQADAAIENYNETVLNSLREVADKLASWQTLQTQLDEQKKVVSQLNGTYDMQNERYRAGLSNYISVLDAENALMQQKGTLVDLQARESDVYAGLMLALGGGYVPPANP